MNYKYSTCYLESNKRRFIIFELKSVGTVCVYYCCHFLFVCYTFILVQNVIKPIWSRKINNRRILNGQIDLIIQPKSTHQKRKRKEETNFTSNMNIPQKLYTFARTYVHISMLLR